MVNSSGSLPTRYVVVQIFFVAASAALEVWTCFSYIIEVKVLFTAFLNTSFDVWNMFCGRYWCSTRCMNMGWWNP